MSAPMVGVLPQGPDMLPVRENADGSLTVTFTNGTTGLFRLASSAGQLWMVRQP